MRSAIASNGVSFIERDGAGPPIVLLHGIGSRGESFRPLMDAFPPGCYLLAWDAPGYGRSTPLDQDWPLAEHYAKALEGVLAERGLGRVILIGHSLGTRIAASYARLHGERLSGLVLMSPSLGYGAPAGGQLPDAARARLVEFDGLGPQAYAASRAPQLIHEPGRHPLLVAKLAATMATMAHPGYGQAVRMLASGRILDDVAVTTPPCLILCGQEDMITPPSAARRVEAACSARPVAAQTRLVVIPSTGHMIYLEATDTVAAHVSDFANQMAWRR
jgi:pimeloyl-ACP methyl ester carboxylesterase